MSEVIATQPQSDAALHDAPVLHYELAPWPRVFWGNLTDLILRREPAPVETTSQPFLSRRRSGSPPRYGPRHFLESYGDHIVLVVMIYIVSTAAWFNRPVKLEFSVRQHHRGPLRAERVPTPDQHWAARRGQAAQGTAQAGEAGDPVGAAESGQQSSDHRDASQHQAESRCPTAQHRGVDQHSWSANCSLATAVVATQVATVYSPGRGTHG